MLNDFGFKITIVSNLTVNKGNPILLMHPNDFEEWDKRNKEKVKKND